MGLNLVSFQRVWMELAGQGIRELFELRAVVREYEGGLAAGGVNSASHVGGGMGPRAPSLFFLF